MSHAQKFKLVSSRSVCRRSTAVLKSCQPLVAKGARMPTDRPDAQPYPDTAVFAWVERPQKAKPPPWGHGGGNWTTPNPMGDGGWGALAGFA
jgi:hypothetical protein